MGKRDVCLEGLCFKQRRFDRLNDPCGDGEVGEGVRPQGTSKRIFLSAAVVFQKCIIFALKMISMSREQSYILEYLICVIGAFARRFALTNASSYRYLQEFKGLDFLVKHYEAEHTLSIDDAVDDLAVICHRHGGALA